MRVRVAQSPRRNKVRRAKAANRPSKFRERLLEVGARLFVERGIANVSVEELIAEADVSRATFYGFFANKNELAAAILQPVFDAGIEVLKNICELPPRKAAEELVDLYLHLLRDHRHALLLTGSLDGTVFPYIKAQHDDYQAVLQKVLRVIESDSLLKNGSVELTLEVLAKTAIPLLRIYKDREELEPVFRETMLGLILRA